MYISFTSILFAVLVACIILITISLNSIIDKQKVVIKMAGIRVGVMELGPDIVITSDNVAMKVSAAAYYQIKDAKKAILEAEDYRDAIAQLAQSTLRSIICKITLDEFLPQQDKLNQTLSLALEQLTKNWAVRIDQAEFKVLSHS